MGASVAAGLGLSGVAVADGFFLEPYLIRITRHDIHIDNLPEAFEGFQIAQVADLHHSGIVSLNYIRKVIRMMSLEQPDLVVLTGDYVTGDVDYIEPKFGGHNMQFLAGGFPALSLCRNDGKTGPLERNPGLN